MTLNTIDTTPYWDGNATAPEFPALSRNLSVDVVVIGGGITGVTTAYLLKEAGLTVALVERGRCAGGETGHTTGHLTAVTDRWFTDLVRTFGQDHATAVWDAGFAALSEIDTLIRREQIACDFRWVPAFLHTSLVNGPTDEPARLEAEAALVSKAGFDATYLGSIPGLNRPGVRFEGQATFHPVKYLRALLARIPGQGSHVFEQSPVDTMSESPRSVSVGAHTISTGFVVVATHVPIAGTANMLSATLLQTDLYPYSTYALGARIAKDRLPEALFWDMADPYTHMRVVAHDTHDYLIFGGADHKTGQVENTRDRFAQLEQLLAAVLPGAAVTHKWSGQVIETRDGLPYIGETATNQFAITGFSGNGLTLGTVGAMMARDAITGRSNPWRELFDVGRTRVTEGLWDYVTENKDYPYYMIRDRFAGADGRSLRALQRGEGKILDVKGERVAAYRDADGTTTLLSPICTHLGCTVAWNQAESSWDCPCHGSRFTVTGKVMGGPAEKPLAPARVGAHATLAT